MVLFSLDVWSVRIIVLVTRRETSYQDKRLYPGTPSYFLVIAPTRAAALIFTSLNPPMRELVKPVQGSNTNKRPFLLCPIGSELGLSMLWPAQKMQRQPIVLGLAKCFLLERANLVQYLLCSDSQWRSNLLTFFNTLQLALKVCVYIDLEPYQRLLCS